MKHETQTDTVLVWLLLHLSESLSEVCFKIHVIMDSASVFISECFLSKM